MPMQLVTWDFEICPRKDNHQNNDISSYIIGQRGPGWFCKKSESKDDLT